MRFKFIGQIGIKATDLIKGLRIQWFHLIHDCETITLLLCHCFKSKSQMCPYLIIASQIYFLNIPKIFFFRIVTIFLAKKWNIFAWVGSVWEVGWGIGTNQRDQIWRNFATLAKSSNIPAIFESSFGICHTFKPILTNFVCLWADFHWCKWPKIEK